MYRSRLVVQAGVASIYAVSPAVSDLSSLACASRYGRWSPILLPGSQEVFPPQCQPFQFSPEIRPACPFAAGLLTRKPLPFPLCAAGARLQAGQLGKVAREAAFGYRLSQQVSCHDSLTLCPVGVYV